MIRPGILLAIKSGEVELAFRRWDRPRVRVGTRVGLVEVTSVERVAESGITAAQARRSGTTLEELTGLLAAKADKPAVSPTRPAATTGPLARPVQPFRGSVRPSPRERYGCRGTLPARQAASYAVGADHRGRGGDDPGRRSRAVRRVGLLGRRGSGR